MSHLFNIDAPLRCLDVMICPAAGEISFMCYVCVYLDIEYWIGRDFEINNDITEDTNVAPLLSEDNGSSTLRR